MITARNAAMGFNRYLDRNIDKKNERTSNREIPAGVISPQKALAFILINSLLFIIAAFLINKLVFFLSPIALLVVLGYSYTKKFTSLCHFVLGLGLALAPIGAYLAVTGEFNWLPLFFSFTVLFWVSGFDIIYALQDEEFDKKEKLNSVPVRLGRRKSLLLSSIIHILSTIFVVIAGKIGEFNLFYWIGTTIFIVLLVYQHLIIKENDLSRVNLAFFTTNGIASCLFALFVLVDIFI